MRPTSTDFRIEVRFDGWRGPQDELRVTLRAPAGETLYDHREPVSGGPARPLYEALMTAVAEAIRHDCRHLAMDFSPPGLLDLVRQDRDIPLSAVERSLRQWTLLQLQTFDSVSLQARTSRMGQARADESMVRMDVFRREGIV